MPGWSSAIQRSGGSRLSTETGAAGGSRAWSPSHPPLSLDTGRRRVARSGCRRASLAAGCAEVAARGLLSVMRPPSSSLGPCAPPARA